MDVRDLSRHELGMLAAAVGPNRKVLVSMVFAAIVDEHGLDVQIERDGKDFALVGIETEGDAVVAGHRLPIHFGGLPESARTHVLARYTADIPRGHDLWRRRTNTRLARLGVPPIPANDA